MIKRDNRGTTGVHPEMITLCAKVTDEGEESWIATHPVLHVVELHRVMRRSMREKTHDGV
jgi:hypothetical protein